MLRAMDLPAGEHTLEFRFEPRIWEVGEKVSLASSLLLILLAVGGAITWLMRKKSAESA